MTASRGPVDVALATAMELDEPDFDLEPLRVALVEAGVRCVVLAWDDPRADFASARMTILRSTWNYPQSPEAFVRWVAATARVTSLWNREAWVRWNLHKRYLLELERAGVPIAPTQLVNRGTAPELSQVSRARGWHSVVVKPAISASSMGTVVVRPDGLERGQRHLERLADRGDVLLQEYLPAVEGHGERALVWIDGVVTHAVRKSPRFAGQHESTSERAVDISAAESVLAEQAMAVACSRFAHSPLYGRIDVAPGPDGKPVVMELELIEPSLYFTRSRRAVELMVAAVVSRLGGAKKEPEAG